MVPMLAIALLFAVGRATVSPADVAVSLGLVVLITTSAGWLAGPLAAAEPRRLLAAAYGYAIALIITNAALSLIQAASDTWAAAGRDPLAITGALAGRAAYALAATAYLIVPAIVVGAAWSVAARGLKNLLGSRTS